MNTIHKLLSHTEYQGERITRQNVTYYIAPYSRKKIIHDFHALAKEELLELFTVTEYSFAIIDSILDIMHQHDPSIVVNLMDDLIIPNIITLWSHDFMFHQGKANPFFIDYLTQHNDSRFSFYKYFFQLCCLIGDDFIHGMTHVCQKNTDLMYALLTNEHFYHSKKQHPELLFMTDVDFSSITGQKLLLAFTDTPGATPEAIFWKLQFSLYGPDTERLGSIDITQSETSLHFS